ncbi:hypothetical protein A2930_02670 [Candidatus Giovannonibacteria bacterium RIFCSPLOWO2_01_FULL_45_34]|uniref:PNPLA domain-containing protein n=1 Tax=Candidatus Giovannonibacteria bacterium RIFCSPLOWO2_01_FULL_45_34 TaxID=1798351 RepID=A0A1F5WYY2_9BACT|nr:MAG: hypothetical protein A3C73_04745 [Candidatus Giovannonibacteria bacterium RIFCSPHIGHO2_02_FULL_44_11]OGF80511.1 MAG: hypothetical protein A2930_02670 [Candidatus Giovannonibacteria bacterium RIFCSPLOWO2_01_FULL_45_34]
MILMPHSDYGRVGFVLGSGGLAECLPQSVQVGRVLKAGIKPDYINGESGGGLVGLDLEKAFAILKNYFYSPWTIYDLNPEIEAIIDKVLRGIPKSPFHKHESWRDLWRDFETQSYNAKQVVSLVFRILHSIPTLPGDIKPSPQDFSPLWQELTKELRDSGLVRVKNIFDPAPLAKTLSKVLDLKKIMEQDAAFHILVCSGAEEHIFSTGKILPAEYLPRMRVPLHEIASEEQLLSAVMASSAVRPYFPPVNINGTYYWDVGGVNPLPVQYAIDAGCDTIFVFVKNYWNFESNLEASIAESFIEEGDKKTRKIFIDTHEKIFLRKEENIKIHFIYPQTLHPDLELLWVSPEAIEHTLKIETEATDKWLKDNLNIDVKD